METQTDGISIAQEVRETLWKNRDFIWALKSESNLDWQRRNSIEKEEDMFWSFPATGRLYPGVLVD